MHLHVQLLRAAAKTMNDSCYTYSQVLTHQKAGMPLIGVPVAWNHYNLISEKQRPHFNSSGSFLSLIYTAKSSHCCRKLGAGQNLGVSLYIALISFNESSCIGKNNTGQTLFEGSVTTHLRDEYNHSWPILSDAMLSWITLPGTHWVCSQKAFTVFPKGGWGICFMTNYPRPANDPYATQR